VSIGFMTSTAPGSSRRKHRRPQTPAARKGLRPHLAGGNTEGIGVSTDIATGTTSTTCRTRSHALRVPRPHRSHGAL
jgi:hypothetical protein